jgi:hypothetical protein
MSTKLKLNLNDLMVDTFRTGDARADRSGTIHARAETEPVVSVLLCVFETEALIECHSGALGCDSNDPNCGNTVTICTPTNEDWDYTCGVCAGPTGGMEPECDVPLL